MDFSTLNIVRGIFTVFVVLGAVQPSQSFQYRRTPSDPFIVVEGVSNLPVALEWELTFLTSESVLLTTITRNRPGEVSGVTIAGSSGDQDLVVSNDYSNNYAIRLPSTLLIKSVTNADEYDYTFAVTLTAAFPKPKTSLTTIVVFVPPQITQHPPRTTRVNIGQNVSLLCNASGDPLPNITWTRDGVQTRDFNVSGHVLHLVNVQRNDTGSYRCTATNGYGNNATRVGLVSINCPACESKEAEITLIQDWKSGYSNPASEEYKDLESLFLAGVYGAYAQHPEKGLSRVVLDEIREGSVIALMEMLFPLGTADPLKPLQDEIKDGKLGPYISVNPQLDLNPTTPGPPTTKPMTSQTTGITSDASWVKERTILYAVFLTIIFLLVLIIVVVLVLLWRKRNVQGDINSESTRYPRQNDTVMKMPAGSEPGYQFPNLGYDGSREYMGLQPRTRSWEVEREDVQIDKIIGKGAFSQVAKATTWNINGIQGQTTLAVKMLKQNAPESDRKDLLSELELMKKLKPHPHVVKLMGCVTESDPLLVLIEYIPYGDLLGYLRKSRGLKDTYFQDPDVNPQTNLTAEQLMKYACQIADGMCYLSSKKIIHRDLAARNVLVGEGEKCKVTDFGMARNVQQDDIYTKQSRGRLPVKWTAYEALLYGTHTTQSDVWSYGVLLYEIFTVGGSPYPGIKGREIAAKLQHGYRMPKPKHVNEQLYQIMVKCWQENPNDRPTFAALKDTMLKMSRNYKTYVNLKEYDDRLYANVDDLTMA